MTIDVLKTTDEPLGPLLSKTAAVIGYGNQGHAHALNLRDCGVNVIIGSRKDSRGWKLATEAKFTVTTIADATAQADLVILALPDEVQPDIYTEQIEPYLHPRATLGFIHGFNIHYRFIEPPEGIGVVMVAPKGPGETLRNLFVQGRGLPCLYAMFQDSGKGDAEEIGPGWAAGIGSARAAIIRTTFADETETDLFGEQAVLCGGLSELIRAAFETLIEAGYPSELAYLECCHEVKQVADLIYTRGLAGMNTAISNTAEFGAYTAGPKVIDESVRARMREVLEEIRSGTFAAALHEDYQQGFAWFESERMNREASEIESAGRSVRALMKWFDNDSE